MFLNTCSIILKLIFWTNKFLNPIFSYFLKLSFKTDNFLKGNNFLTTECNESYMYKTLNSIARSSAIYMYDQDTISS